MKQSLPTLLLASLAFVPAQFAAAQEPVLPAPPQQVIRLLPAKPEGWKVTRSTAESYLTEVLQTTAIRIFRELPKEASAGGAPIGESDLARMEFRITDTGGFPTMMAQFSNFKVGTEGPVEKKMIKSYPAIGLDLGDTEYQWQILINNRFIVELIYTGLEDRELDDWIDAINWSGIVALRGRPYEDKSMDVNITKIDQMKPTRNRSYSIRVVSKAEIASQIAEAARMDAHVAAGGSDEPERPVRPGGNPDRRPPNRGQ